VSRRLPGIADVAAAYAPKFAHEVRTEWAIALVYRPFSFVLTPLFVALGASPSGVTLLGFACALTLPWFATHAGEAAWIYVGVLGVVFCILDCVDGDVARVTGRVSRLGAYADFITDVVYRIALYSSIGLVLDRVGNASLPLAAYGDDAGLVIGLACAVLAIVARACRLYVDAYERHRETARKSAPNNVAVAFLSGLDHLLPIGVLAFGVAGRLEWLLAYLFVYSLGDLVLTQRSVWRRLQ
jgi:phosphatidylglycerophosphate synthase